MKLFDSIGPNPHVVRMFLSEKGIEIEKETIDIMAGDCRQKDYVERNPTGTTPCLQLDNGSYLSEIIPICEYLEEKHPEPVLIGNTPEQRAETRMWTRRIDINITEHLANGFRFGEGLEIFKDRMLTCPEASSSFKALAQFRLEWLNGLIEGKDYICGDRFSMADILLYCFVAFASTVGQPLNPNHSNLTAWFERVKARASAAA